MEQSLRGLFDRGPDYAEFTANLAGLTGELPGLDEATTRRRLRQLDQSLTDIARIDFFPGPVQVQARASRDGVAAEIDRRFSPGEPRSAARTRAPPVAGGLPGSNLGNPAAPLGGPGSQRLADPPPHRPGARFLWLEPL